MTLKPSITRAAKLPDIDQNGVSCRHAFFSSQDSVDRKWRKPEVLSPDEFQIVLMRGLFRSYIPATLDGKQAIMYLRAKGKDKLPGANGPAMPPGMKGRMPNTMGMQRIYGAGMMPNMMPGMMKGMMPQQMMMGQQPGADDIAANIEMVKVAVDQVSTEKDGRPPSSLPGPRGHRECRLPIAASLNRSSAPCVWNRSEDGIRASVEFLGINVQRARSGLTASRAATGATSISSGRFVPSSPSAWNRKDPLLKAYGVVWAGDRLLTPRPYLGRNQQYPTVDLPSLDRTLKAIEDAAKANAAAAREAGQQVEQGARLRRPDRV